MAFFNKLMSTCAVSYTHLDVYKRQPYNEAERQVIYAIHEGTTSLMAAHRSLWNELWESDILIEGDDLSLIHI